MQSDMPFTSIRPTYIYGPQNYNPLEEYFFDRVANDRPVAIPGTTHTLTSTEIMARNNPRPFVTPNAAMFMSHMVEEVGI